MRRNNSIYNYIPAGFVIVGGMVVYKGYGRKDNN